RGARGTTRRARTAGSRLAPAGSARGGVHGRGRTRGGCMAPRHHWRPPLAAAHLERGVAPADRGGVGLGCRDAWTSTTGSPAATGSQGPPELPEETEPLTGTLRGVRRELL